MPKAVIYLFTVLAVYSGFAYAAPQKYELDLSHTNLYWHASHFGYSTSSGKFANVEGVLMLDEENPENSSVEATIYTGSVITGIERFDAHLKNEDFFNVDKFPVATYKSSSVELTDEDTAIIHGYLTLLGVTKHVNLDVKLNKIGPLPINQRQTAGFSASTIIKRSDFGMTYALPGVPDEVKITIETEANLVN